MRSILRRLSRRHGTAVAYLALFVALGGSAYAVTVTGKSIKDGTITGRDVKNRSLGTKKLTGKAVSSLTGQRGPAGAAGPQGPQGDRGPEGPAGPLLETLPSGKTLRGKWAYAGRRVTTNGYAPLTTVSFQFPLAQPPQTAPIVMPIGAEPNADCPGNFFDPQAAPGRICVYVRRDDGNLGVRTDSGVMTRFGIEIFPVNLGTDQNTAADGTWAVTAP